MPNTIHDFDVETLSGGTQSLKDLEGKVALIVNVASQCGFTPQYEGLQKLHEQYGERGLVVMGFPCNQFGKQEPGNKEEIATFCESRYSVTFPMYAKIEVNGDNTHPLYGVLKSEAPGVLGSKAIKWNFTKFLVDKTGKVVKRYASATKPEAMSADIEKLL